MDEELKELVERLKVAHNPILLAVIEYGAVTRGPQTTRKSDCHILIITEKLTAEDLRTGRPIAKWWVEAGYNLPVYFTEKEFTESLDVFAIEFRHIKRAYRVLFGKDILAGREASKENLRLQVEYELRGKLLRLRSLYLPSGESPQALNKLMTDSIDSFTQFMRPILEIVGEEPPLDRSEIVARVGEKLQIDLTPLGKIIQLREHQIILTETECNHLFAAYIDCLTSIIEAINNL